MRVALMCMLLIMPSVAWGAEGALPLELVLRAEDGGVLTLEQAVALAIQNNRLVKNAALEIERSEERVGAARTQRWPAFTINILESMLLTPVEFEIRKGQLGTFPATGPIPADNTKLNTPQRLITFMTANATQPLSQLYRIGLGIQQLEVARQVSREGLRSHRQSAVHDVKRAYYAVLQTQSALDATEEAIGFYRELDRVVEDYLAQQFALKFESLDVKTRLARTEYDAFSLRNALASQKEQLNDLLGRDIRTDFRATPVPETTPVEADLVASQGRALKQRPEVEVARLKVKNAEYDHRIKKSEYIPDVSLAVNYISPFGVEFLPQNILTVGLMLTWEPFDWGRRKREVAERSKAIEQANNELRQIEPQVLMDVNSRFRKLHEMRALLSISQLAREAERERLRVTMNKYAQRAVLLKDVLQAQASLADANRQHQQALLSVWTAKAEFERALGEE